MEWHGTSVALYGRFSPKARERATRLLVKAGATVVRDFTSHSDVLVVGALAAALVDPGHLRVRIAAARSRGAPVLSERGFFDALKAPSTEIYPLSLADIERQVGLTRDSVEALAAFDVVVIKDDHCRFADGQTLKTAGEILQAGRSLGDCVRILVRARDLAPRGRRKIVLDAHGAAQLSWESGFTTLEGQGLLPYADGHATLDDLFEEAAVAEADGDLELAARRYEQIGRSDRKDPTALFNLGNVHLAARAFAQAIIAYRRALARDPAFVQAQYNLALALEELGQLEPAREALLGVLDRDGAHADALFNLAQLELNRGDLLAARARFETYLSGQPPADWADKARKAIVYLNARLSA